MTCTSLVDAVKITFIDPLSGPIAPSGQAMLKQFQTVEAPGEVTIGASSFSRMKYT